MVPTNRVPGQSFFDAISRRSCLQVLNCEGLDCSQLVDHGKFLLSGENILWHNTLKALQYLVISELRRVGDT